MNTVRMKSAPALGLLLLLCAACAGPGETIDLELDDTHVFLLAGLSVDYPSGWLAKNQGSFAVISENANDHRRGLCQGSVLGYQIVMWYRPLATLGLPEDITLSELHEHNLDLFDWDESILVKDVELAGEPAISVQGREKSTCPGWMTHVDSVRGDNVFGIAVAAPDEETLLAFDPTWADLVSSVRPVGD